MASDVLPSCSRCGRTIFRWELDSGLADESGTSVCSDCLKKIDPNGLSARLAQIKPSPPSVDEIPDETTPAVAVSDKFFFSARARWIFAGLAIASVIVFILTVRAILSFDLSSGRQETIVEANRLLENLRESPALKEPVAESNVNRADETTPVISSTDVSTALDNETERTTAAARALGDALKQTATLEDGLDAASGFRDRLETLSRQFPGTAPARHAGQLAARLRSQIDETASLRLDEALNEIRQLSEAQQYNEAQGTLNRARESLNYASASVQEAYAGSLDALYRALTDKRIERVAAVETRLSDFLRADDFDAFDDAAFSADTSDDPLVRAATERWILICREKLLYLSDTQSIPALATHRRLTDALARYDNYLKAGDFPAATIVADSFADISTTAVVEPYGVSIASAFRQAARSARLLEDLSRGGFAPDALLKQASTVTASLSGTTLPVLSPLTIALYDYQVANGPDDLLPAARLESLDGVQFRRLHQRLRVRIERMNAALLALDELRALTDAGQYDVARRLYPSAKELATGNPIEYHYRAALLDIRRALDVRTTATER